MKFGIGQSVKRIEDPDLITGRGQYTDDIELEGQLFAAFVRSPMPHARILAIETNAARQHEGVRAVLTHVDLETMGVGKIACGLPMKRSDGKPMPRMERGGLAANRVRYVGDPVAMVVATSKQLAMDAAELVDVEYDELAPVPSIEDARIEGAPLVWDEALDNEAFDWQAGDRAATEKAFANAAHVTTLKLVNQRVTAASLEGRAANASFDRDSGVTTLYLGSQGVASIRNGLARVFEEKADTFRVITKDVGGGFGMKSFLYPEYLCVVAASKMLSAPVKWAATRSEAFLTDLHGRDLITEAEVAFDETHKILAMRARTDTALGAYLSSFGPGIQTFAGGLMLGGVYDIPHIHNHVRGYMTTTSPVDAYRGAGRPEAAYITERLLETAAHELGVDPAELRRRNFIQPENFPYRTPLGQAFDGGAFETVLDHALATADWHGFDDRAKASKDRGKLRGRGLAYYIEITSFGTVKEWADARFTEDGNIEVAIGTQSNGQGHATAYRQILSEKLGVDFNRIRIVQGDTERLAQGGGTGGSRSVHIGGGALLKVGDAVIHRALEMAAALWEVDASEISYSEGNCQAEGRNQFIGLFDLAVLAQTPSQVPDHAREVFANGLDCADDYSAEAPTYPNGCHICEVEIDQETGTTTLDRYVVVDDFGKLINPMLVAGQVHGGVAQGVGQALGELCHYDEDGQLLSGSFMDYFMPAATHMPHIEFQTVEVPHTLNPLGMKGCGEAGTIGALPSVMNAINDALRREGLGAVDMPATPLKLWEVLQSLSKTDAA
ncbi:MAG: xanthine dehydrogenase family protein molybdopterin-binding subunit [Pseudomonadota bacterium]